jgi:restriction system protein
MLPLLKLAATNPGEELSLQSAVETLSEQFSLTDEERQQLLPSGRQPIFVNRVGWARTYMKKAGLLEQTRRGYFKISERGLSVLSQNPPAINVNFLERFPEFIEFRNTRNERTTEGTGDDAVDTRTPEELLEIEYQKIRDDLASQILQTIKQCSPAFFERLVVELLVKRGYGGSRSEAGSAVGRSGDGGIDGIIK